MKILKRALTELLDLYLLTLFLTQITKQQTISLLFLVGGVLVCAIIYAFSTM